MRTAAPGKLVLSGAYAVLEGAPALVSAVNRYAIADTDRQPNFFPKEVLAAMPRNQVPHVDISQLWDGDRKLGMGSSAAVVVSAVAARMWDQHPGWSQRQVRDELLPVALAAHRKAQGGGSGIDVAASAWGGTVACRLTDGNLQVTTHELPDELQWSVFWARKPSSTPHMLTAVRTARARQPRQYERLMGYLSNAARRAHDTSRAEEFLESLSSQVRGLTELGDWAGVPIVPTALRPVIAQANEAGTVVIPSGAGGGDIVLVVSRAALDPTLRDRLRAAGLVALEVRLGAQGVHELKE